MEPDYKLKICIRPSKYIKYDINQLYDTLQYYCWQKLKHLDLNELPPIYIEIGTKYTDELDCCGMSCALNDHISAIFLSTKQLLSDKYRYKSGLKSLLHMFLHEFYHMQLCVEAYIRTDKSISLHDFKNERYSKFTKECEDMVESGIDEDLTYYYSTEEIAANAYAFENLAYIENLYGYGFLVIPPNIF